MERKDKFGYWVTVHSGTCGACEEYEFENEDKKNYCRYYKSYYYKEDSCRNQKDAETSSSGGCFLTSACMHAMMEKFDDSCHELTILRWFRDNHVTNEDVELYYCIAPRIVTAIDKAENTHAIYQDIYNRVVSVCVKAIEQGEYDFAYSVYRNAVLDLQAAYLA